MLHKSKCILPHKNTTMAQQSNHIEWCSCTTPNYGDPGCDCPDAEVFNTLRAEGLGDFAAFQKMFETEKKFTNKPVEVVRRSNKSIQY